MVRYRKDSIGRHIRRKHPGCPEFVVDYLAEQIASKEWEGASLGMAVGIAMQNLLRHQMTDYDQLRLSGVGRSAARKRVQNKIALMLAHWEKLPTTKPDD